MRKKALEPYTAKFTDAYKEVGTTMEGWLQRAILDVNTLLRNAWYQHTKFDSEPVIRRFDEVVAMCDISNEILQKTPKLNLSQQSEAFRLLQDNAIFLDSEAVKSITDACGARFENTAMKHCQSIVTTLRALLSHYFSLIKTIRQIESGELVMPSKKQGKLSHSGCLNGISCNKPLPLPKAVFTKRFSAEKDEYPSGNLNQPSVMIFGR